MMYHYFIGGSRDLTKWTADEAPPQFNTASLFHDDQIAYEAEFIVKTASKPHPKGDFTGKEHRPRYETYKLHKHIVVENDDIYIYGKVSHGG